MRANFLSLITLSLFTVCSFGQVKFGDVIRKTKHNVNTVKDKKEKVETTVDPIVGTTPPQDTTKKQEPVKTEDKKTDNLAIGDEGDEKKNDGKGTKVKQSKEFIKDSNKGTNTTTTPPKNGGSLVDPNSQKKNIAIEDEGAEDDKKKDKGKSKSTENNTITPK